MSLTCSPAAGCYFPDLRLLPLLQQDLHTPWMIILGRIRNHAVMSQCDDTSCTNTIMRINFVMFVGFSHILITVRMKRASFTTFIITILNSSLYSLPLLEEVVQMTLVLQVNCPPERKRHSDHSNLYVSV